MKRTSFSIWLLGMFVLLACGSLTPIEASPAVTQPQTGATATKTRLEWHRCSTALPAELECAQMQVPLDYAVPDGPAITLGMNRLKATDPASRIGSLIFEPGGPGGAGTDYVRAQALGVEIFTPKLRKYFDIVGFDPRGVGTSTAVKCDPKLWNEILSLFPRDKAAYDAMVMQTTAFGQSCLKRTGPLLGHIDTLSVVRDLDAVRAALGDDKLNYLGLSYGTMVGAEYAEMFPTRIRVMALDGALDHSQSETTVHFVEAIANEQVFGRFAAWCAETKECALNGRDVLEEFDALVKQADEKPIPAPGCVKSGECRATVTGDDIRFNVQGKLLFKEPISQIGLPGWPGLAKALAKAINGDASDLSSPMYQSESNGDFAETAIQCVDWPSETTAKYRGLQAMRLFDKAAAPHTQGATQSWLIQTRCRGWPVPVENAPRALTAKGAPPILLVNATHDPSTSMQWALEMTSQLPSSVLLIRDGDGHTTYLNSGESQVRAAIDDYLVTGKTPPPNTVLPN